jgi:AcrR family transcriptional regulator
MALDTEQKISESFLTLCKSHSLDSITVKMVVETSEINRKTFYYHYDGIEDLSSSIVVNGLIKAIDGRVLNATWQDGFTSALEYLVKNKVLILALHSSSYWNGVHQKFEEYMDEATALTVQEALLLYKNRGGKVHLSNAEKDFIVGFYSDSIISMLERWISSNMKVTPSEYAKFVHRFYNHNMFSVFDLFSHA